MATQEEIDQIAQGNYGSLSQTMQNNASGFDWGSLAGTGVGFLGDFFANNMRQAALGDALRGLQSSPVLGELRSLRGLLGTQVGPQHEDIIGYDRNARAQEIKNDLFGMVRPDLENQAAQIVSQDYLRGTLGLDLGGRGSPLQQAFSKNLGSEIARANVLGNQMALNEESQMRNWLLNDIQGIRQLAGEDLDLAKAFARAQEQAGQGNADLLSGVSGSVGDLLSSIFGGGGAGSGVASGVSSALKSMFSGNSAALSGVEPFADIFGDSAMEIVEALGSSAGDLLSSFGALPAGVFSMAPGMLGAADAAALSGLFSTGGLESILGGGAFSSFGGGVAGGAAGGAGAAAGGAGAATGGLGSLAALTPLLGLGGVLAIAMPGITKSSAAKREEMRKRREAMGVPGAWMSVPPGYEELKNWLETRTPQQLAQPEIQQYRNLLASMTPPPPGSVYNPATDSAKAKLAAKRESERIMQELMMLGAGGQ